MSTISTTYSVDTLQNDIRKLMLLAAHKRHPIAVVDKGKRIEGYFIDKKSFRRLEQVVEDVLDTHLVEDRLIQATPQDYETIDIDTL
jgi:PHD/YefM family antitoxin component YafN of YafNO toxin-antitoxin module